MATRKLILKRKKVITGFAVKAFIYLADSIGDFMIKGIRCRELGFLKNGGSAEYDIPTTSTTIYVVSNRMSPDKHHSSCQVPDGDGNVERFITIFQNMPHFEILTGEQVKNLGMKEW